MTDEMAVLIELRDEVARLREEVAAARAAYLTVDEAAERTRLSSDHILRAIRGRELAAANKGNGRRPVWRIAVADLDAWMRAGRADAVPAKPARDDLVRQMMPGL